MPERAEVPASWRDWTEDFPLDNGNYHNRCTTCDLMFYGHKRRAVCKVCASRHLGSLFTPAEAPPPAVTLAEMISEVERELELRARVYPEWIDRKRITPARADLQTRRMRAVLDTLKMILTTTGAKNAEG